MTDASFRGELSLFKHRVRDLVRRPLVTCPADASVASAAGVMAAHGVASVVVLDASGAPAGIMTARDLRSRVVAQGRSAEAPVSAVMSAPLLSIEGDRLAFDALLTMTRREIHHLGVTEAGRLVGLVGSDDFAAFWLVHPVALAGEIDAQPSVEALAAVAPRLSDVVRRLADEGATPGDIGELVADLNDRLVRRTIRLAEEALDAEGLGRPPVAYAWIAAGSEGRREQTLRTDQDSGLVYQDPEPAVAGEAARYFARLAARVGADLVRLGFARCQGGFMAENPRWCQPLAVWLRYFRKWLTEPAPEHLVAASVYADLRPVSGAEAPARTLRRWLGEQAPRHTPFLRHLARSAVAQRPPVTLFGRFMVPWFGPRRGTLDIKRRGVFPMTQAMRVHALALGLEETGTLDRLAGATARGAFTAGEAAELKEAYATVVRVRLGHQLAAVAAGTPADDLVRLGRIDRLVLGEAFRTLAWLQRALEEHFHTAYL